MDACASADQALQHLSLGRYDAVLIDLDAAPASVTVGDVSRLRAQTKASIVVLTDVPLRARCAVAMGADSAAPRAQGTRALEALEDAATLHSA